MRSEDRFVVTGTSREIVERRLLALRAEPAADWSSYRVPELTCGGESTKLAASVRLTRRGADVLVEATYDRRVWPFSVWRAVFPVAVLDARRLLRAELGAPPEHLDQAAEDAVMVPAVALMKKRTRQLIGARIVTGIASIVLSIVSLAIGPAHGHARSGPPLREFDSAAVSAQLAFRYGISGAQCNDRHPLRYDHLGQQFTCVAGAATYRLTVTDLDPFEFTLVEAT